MNKKSHPLYVTWRNMVARCRLSSKDAKWYAKRGITVCKRWLVFENFISDMFPTFVAGLTLERKKSHLGYSISNCKWATAKEQANNRTSNRIFEYDGITKNIQGWSEFSGMKFGTLLRRLDFGWTIKEALQTPVRRWGR